MFRRLIVLAMVAVFAGPAKGQSVAGRLVVLYRGQVVPGNADALALAAGVQTRHHLSHLGASVFTVNPAEEQAAVARLRMRPEVEAVLQDRLVQGHALMVKPVIEKPVVPVSTVRVANAMNQDTTSPAQGVPVGVTIPRSGLIRVQLPTPLVIPVQDAGYVNASGWAVQAAGGYGRNVPGGMAVGPWNTSLGAGVRIAVLDSGVDASHPDLAASLAVNMSEVDQTALPSVCDDGSPQDQQGHGTWAASLAAAGIGGGQLIGVAPQATLINIKVLERMPGTGSTALAQCEAGQTGGMLSWVLAGINDAIAQKADVISLSLGTIVDLTTGDGAGWKASFDRATYAATQAGVVIVAAAGNDGLDLSAGQYAELPAQARGVLEVTAATNPACAENLKTGATCVAGPVTRAYYSNHGIVGAVAAPGGSYPAGPDSGVSGWILGGCSNGVPGTLDGLPGTGASLGCFGIGHAQYIQAMGTSASAPLVAGAAAIVKAAHPGWTAAQVVSALQSSATSVPGMVEPEVNLAGALMQ